MGWRYRRSVSVAPGARINVTGNGVSSVSFGGRGATLNLGKGGTRTTVGLPGSGVSYSSRTSSGSSLGVGLGLIGLLFLVIAAARGNKLAQGGLILLGLGVSYLLLSSGSHSNAVVGVQSGATSSYSSRATAVPTSAPQPIAASAPAVVQSAVASPLPSSFEAVVMTTTGANVRSAPSIAALVLRQLPKGARLTVVKTEGDWCQLRDDSQAVLGWVHKSILRSVS